MNIRGLTEKEDALLIQVANVHGSMEEKTQQLMKAGVFEAYNQIHKDYVQLAIEGDIEALKRAVFIQWYGVAEPSCFTGIPSTNPFGGGHGLEEKVEKRCLDLVENCWLSENLDDELQWMLPYYFVIVDFHFELLGKTSVLVKSLRKISESFKLWNDGVPTKSSLEGRGQMSSYWLSIFENY